MEDSRLWSLSTCRQQLSGGSSYSWTTLCPRQSPPSKGLEILLLTICHMPLRTPCPHLPSTSDPPSYRTWAEGRRRGEFAHSVLACPSAAPQAGAPTPQSQGHGLQAGDMGSLLSISSDPTGQRFTPDCTANTSRV